MHSSSYLLSSLVLVFYNLLICIQLFSPYSSFVASTNLLASSKSLPDIVDTKSLNTLNVLTKREFCRVEISRICGDRTNIDELTDLEAFDCLLNNRRNESTDLSPDCHHQLWTYRKHLMTNDGFLKQVGSDCANDIKSSSCYQTLVSDVNAPNSLVDCTVGHKDELKSDICRRTVTLVERVMFSDYELVERFANKCEKDIQDLRCGRNDVTTSKGTQFLPNSQGHTIECLSRFIGELNPDCAIEIIRVAELQADDYHLDRALYFACRDDRERFCAAISSGNGKVYKCLMKNKMEETMSYNCRDQLNRRQKLGWHDYKASGIIFSCKAEIRKNACRREATMLDKHVRLSQILLCLENAAHTGQPIDGECLEEMKQHRKELMEEHSVTPEFLVGCKHDITKYCKKGKGFNGKTIHCLMEKALTGRKENALSAECKVQLEDLVKLADVTEDWRVDPVLKESCQPVVAKSRCHSVPGDHTLDCLMSLLVDTTSNIDFQAMTEECETALFQIQYFISRDFAMDPVLYGDCREDAIRICQTSGNWGDDSKNAGPMVLSCLYRNMDEDDDEKSPEVEKISTQCSKQVKETMRQRALSVNLMPEIQVPCMVDLADKCGETKKDEEMACLQNNLEGLDEKCKKAVIAFTKFEIKNPSVDPYLWKYCHDVIESKCSSKIYPSKSNSKEDPLQLNRKGDLSQSNNKDDDDDDDDKNASLFDCIMNSKPEIKDKPCRTTVEHYQLLQLKNIEFSPKFKALCHGDVIRHCNHWGNQPKTSARLVACLSGIIWNDTISDSTPQISKGCRKQMKYLTLSKIQIESKTEQGTIYNLCGDFVKDLCNDVKPGGGRIFECLRSHREKIDKQDCYNALFKLEQQVNNDNSLDVHLINECETEIKLFCAGRVYRKEYNPQLQTQNLIQCLKFSREKEGFNNERCGKVLQARLLEQNTDSRLNPTLRKACSLDIPKFCSTVAPGDAKVIGCLKKAFVKDPLHLTKSCKQFVEEMLKGAAETDVRLDFTLYKSCESEIKGYCSAGSEHQEVNGGKVEDCLTNLFHSGTLVGTCRDQVQLLIQATQIDIHVDPSLNRACAIDLLKICDGVPAGEGRLMACLLNELDREKTGGEKRLHPTCYKLLSSRYELFQLAGNPAKLESLEDLYATVAESQHKNYFLIIGITIVGIIFIFGLFCGRATRRGKAVSKNK